MGSGSHGLNVENMKDEVKGSKSRLEVRHSSPGGGLYGIDGDDFVVFTVFLLIEHLKHFHVEFQLLSGYLLMHLPDE